MMAYMLYRISFLLQAGGFGISIKLEKVKARVLQFLLPFIGRFNGPNCF